MYSKKIICLANSRKPPSGRCIAGKEITSREWIRPISNRPGHEVSEEERRYESGAKAKLLDIISITLIRASPSLHQVENHILDDQEYWIKEGKASWEEVLSMVDSYDPLFWSNSTSTYHGLHDKVAEANLNSVGSSLKLILVRDLVLQVRSEEDYTGQIRRRVRANFTLNGDTYRLSVTDPEAEEKYLLKGNGEYSLGSAALCVSLVEAWNGFAFRVVASIITPRRCAYD